MSRRKQNKSVSFDDNNEYFSASSYLTTSESNRSDSHERIEKVYCVENSVELDPLYVYGLPQDDDASDVSFVIDEDGHLFRVSDGQWDAFAEVPPAYDADLAFEDTEAFPQYMEGDMVFSERVDGEISDYGSAEWDSDQSVVDDETSDATSQADRLSTGALFGDRPWKSITPLQAVTEIMDAVNVHLPYNLRQLGSQSDSLGDVCDYKASSFSSAQARDILPEHEKIVISIAADFISMDLTRFNAKLKKDLQKAKGFGKLGTEACRTLRLYSPSSASFDYLEGSWASWHKRIEHMQITLISVINTRATLIDVGRTIMAYHAKATEEHEEWRPDPIPRKSQHGPAHFVVNTTYDPETGKHALPESIIKSPLAHEKCVAKQVEKTNVKWERSEKDFKAVMLPLRYAQMQFRNWQLKLEYNLIGTILVLQLAMADHEKLEDEWIQSILGQADDEPSLSTMGVGKENSPGSTEFEDRMQSPVFRHILDLMSKLRASLNANVNAKNHSNPHATGRSLSSGFRFNDDSESGDSRHSPRSDAGTSSTSSEPPSIHSSPNHKLKLKHNNPRASMDTTETSVDETPKNVKVDVKDDATVSESTGLYIHPSHAEKEKLVESEGRKNAHEVYTEVLEKHEATQAAKRLHEFGLIDFENIRRIHRDIMVSLTSHTDERSRLGQAIRHLKDCQMCWCDAGNRPCVRCERLSLTYHFGIDGRTGHRVGLKSDERMIIWGEIVEPCEYLGRRYCIGSGLCDRHCRPLAQKMGLLVDGKAKGKQPRF